MKGLQMTLGSDTRNRRRQLGLGQRDLADLAGVSERFVREVESDKATIRLDKLSDLLDALGLEITLRIKDSA